MQRFALELSVQLVTSVLPAPRNTKHIPLWRRPFLSGTLSFELSAYTFTCNPRQPIDN